MLLCSIALEIFINDGRNHVMLAFPPNVLSNKVYQLMLATVTGLLDTDSQSVAGQRLLDKCTGLSDTVSQSMASYRSGW